MKITIDLDELEQLAKAATQGRWQQYYSVVTGEQYEIHVAYCNARTEQGEADAAYIAQLYPEAMLHLIAVLRATLAFLTTVSPHRANAQLIEGDAYSLASLISILNLIGVQVPGGVQLLRRLPGAAKEPTP